MLSHVQARRILENMRRRADPLRGLDEQQCSPSTHGPHPGPWPWSSPNGAASIARWLNLFPTCLPVLDGLTRRSAARIAELIVATGTSRVVFAEVPPTYMHLLEALARAAAQNRRVRDMVQQLYDVESAQLDPASRN